MYVCSSLLDSNLSVFTRAPAEVREPNLQQKNPLHITALSLPYDTLLYYNRENATTSNHSLSHVLHITTLSSHDTAKKATPSRPSIQPCTNKERELLHRDTLRHSLHVVTLSSRYTTFVTHTHTHSLSLSLSFSHTHQMTRENNYVETHYYI